MRRAVVAVIVAVVLHGALLALLDRVRGRAQVAHRASNESRVALSLVAKRAPLVSPVVDERALEPVVIERVEPDAPPSADSTPLDPAGVEPAETAPVVDEPAQAEHRAPPRSLLERAIAGSARGPIPSIAALDPSLMREERASTLAKRLIDQVARAGPADAGPQTLELVATAEGGYLYTTGGFSAEIHVDGSVTFSDLGNRGGFANSGIDGRKDALRPYQPAITGDRIDPAGQVASGSFDPTAAMLRAQGQDPYAAERSCFLDDTRDLRAELRQKHELVQLASLRRALERAWFDEPISASARRELLFSMWDECREEEIGARARELIESFIRQHLPRESVDGYSEAELVALNARRTSKAEFKPYG